MLDDGVEPNDFTYASLFKACGDIGDLSQGRSLHRAAFKRGYVSNAFVANSIICMYGKCAAIRNAEEVFCSLKDRNTVSWNVLLSAYLEQHEAEKGLLLYRQMQEELVYADELTYVIVLQICCILSRKGDPKPFSRTSCEKALDLVRALHRDSFFRGYASGTLLCNTLISVYGKCGAILEAERVFYKIFECSIVSWNVMLAQYSKQNQPEKALLLYLGMHLHTVQPNSVTFVSALQACCNMARKGSLEKGTSLNTGRALQIDAQRSGFLSNVLVSNALLSMYGKCGTVIDVEGAFAALPQYDVVSLNVMISTYIEHNIYDKAVLLYLQMVNDCFFDHVTVSSMLQACSALGSLDICNNLYFHMVSCGYDQATSTLSSLIQAYASCSSTVDAGAVWSHVHCPDVVSWTACIVSYAGGGNAMESLFMFASMILEGVEPDGLSLTSVLSACTRAGLVVEGLWHFDFMLQEISLTPDAMHLDSLVDLLARAGDFKRIESILKMSSQNAGLTSWLHILGVCCAHGDLEIAKHAFNYAVHLQPKHSVSYILMSTIGAGMAHMSRDFLSKDNL
ncbi:hypothetical protein KP509_17G052300 [Ceratopteris richardii]|uniref:Pentatricopeptide repeat-containing protein n=1 Tax=Ceratopteris richardii TaxID=49495 RepID=A0A8T2SWY3_CERRI|nr:hypothetical protein KP509_17G052300 [Ceratopteris richardii]